MNRSCIIGVLAIVGSVALAFAQSSQPAAPIGAVAVPPNGAVMPPQQEVDSSISRAIQRRLARDPGVDTAQVAVSTRNGVVTLSGQTGALLTKTRAGQLASTIRGVREVRNDIRVTATQRAPWDLRNDVDAALESAPALHQDEIKAQVEQGFVTLIGRVGSWPEKNLAQLLTERVSGVQGVDNKLNVAYDGHRSDSAIRNDILSRLRWDPWLQRPELRVEVANGAVRLNGLVESAAARQHARQDGWVQGVRTVDASGVEVVPNVRVALGHSGLAAGEVPLPTGRLSDSELQSSIVQAASSDPLLLPAHLGVSVNHGIVTLTGHVNNAEAGRRAAQLVRAFPGVEDVINLVQVEPAPNYTDPQIKNNVEVALAQDSRLELQPITVSVHDRRVFLSGNVETSNQRARAAQLAAKVPGVTAVENDIVTPGNANSGVAIAGAPLNMNDRQIERDIREQLTFDPLVDQTQIHVAVSDGVATLSGIVDTPVQRHVAIQCAREGGALEVVDALNLRESGALGPGPTAPPQG